MAFLQPFSVPQRQVPTRNDGTEYQVPSAPHQIDNSQEWILFSPAQAQNTSTASSISKTAGLSKFSDFGSLNTIPRSAQDDDELSLALEDVDELDSLDDGLHAFREPSVFHGSRRIDQSGGTILPAHDGLGMFAASNSTVQEQLWSFEKYNPRRRLYSHIHRKLTTVEDRNEDEVSGLDKARIDRIEKWRLDQSRILLEEIRHENENEKRKQNIYSNDRSWARSHGEFDAVNPAEQADSTDESTETLWQRITQRIRDLMGIDDVLLSVLLGECLPEEGFLTEDPQPSSYEKQTDGQIRKSSTQGWDASVLQRLTRELGVLLQRLSSFPVTFPAKLNASNIEYAGIPVDQTQNPHKPQKASEGPLSSGTHGSLPFLPTIRQTHVNTSHHAQSELCYTNEAPDMPPSPSTEAQYWEQTPDLRTVIGYLSRHFTSNTHSTPDVAHNKIATTNTPDSVRRAQIIRQHHPLVSRSRPFDRHVRRGSMRFNQQLVNASTPNLKRIGTSCASLSTKRSRRDNSDGGSRNYWDIGGSGTLGSEIFTFGGSGAWGEV